MSKKDFFIIIVLTILFSLIIFFVNTYFFTGSIKKSEEIYIDRSLFLEIDRNYDLENEQNTNTSLNSGEIESKSKDVSNTGIVLDSKIIENNNGNKIVLNSFYFDYIPLDFSKDTNLLTFILKNILSSTILNQKVVDLTVELNKIMYDVRGKMKDRKVKLFGVKNYKNEEIVSVFIHEFAHHIDLYYLVKSYFNDVDISSYFYELSWDSVKVIKKGQSGKDFVSGYAMTNKYEDFAESFTYYVLHNESFKKKAKESENLRKKYNYFGDYLFKNKEFQGIDFGNEFIVKDYYWDITKIDIKLQNFLQYLEK